jgi:hypothetical protein
VIDFYDLQSKGAQLGGAGGLLNFSRARPTATVTMQQRLDM